MQMAQCRALLSRFYFSVIKKALPMRFERGSRRETSGGRAMLRHGATGVLATRNQSTTANKAQ
jgi:hypothetical protein